jgi:protein-tyrosine phosphatase
MVRQTSDPAVGRDLAIAGVDDLRDVGGRRTAEGRRVRRSVLYRSTHLAGLGDAGEASFAALGIRCVYDLRTEHERRLASDRLPDGTSQVAIDLLADETGPDPAEMMATLADPEAARAMLGDGRSERFFVQAYRRFVMLPSARSGYARLYRGLATGPLPALVHCTTGKDRTGWAVAALMLYLGVPEDDVLEDYLSSNAILAPVSERLLAAFAARGGDPELLRPLTEVRPAYLGAALAEMRRLYVSPDRYLADGLGLDRTTRHCLREMLLEP